MSILRLSMIVVMTSVAFSLCIWMSGCARSDATNSNLEPVTRGSNHESDKSIKGPATRILAEPASEGLEFRCLDGDCLNPFGNPSTKAVVAVFIATDCPIANAYLPRLMQLQDEYVARGIRFIVIHSSTETTDQAAQSHADEFALSIPVALDNDQTIAKALSARVTPEAIVIRRGSSVPIYRGAIDNLYEDYGKKRPAPTRHYLKDACDELLAGTDISTKSTTPIGCHIAFEE